MSGVLAGSRPRARRRSLLHLASAALLAGCALGGAPRSPGAPPPAGVSAACVAAREDWQRAALDARRALAALEACLAAGPPCATPIAGVRAALAAVAAEQDRIARLCAP